MAWQPIKQNIGYISGTIYPWLAMVSLIKSNGPMAPTGEVGLPVATTLIAAHSPFSVTVVPDVVDVEVVEVDVVEVLVEVDILEVVDVVVLVVDVLVVYVVVVDAVVVVVVTVVVGSVTVVGGAPVVGDGQV